MSSILLFLALFCGVERNFDISVEKSIQKEQTVQSETITNIALLQSLEGGRRYNNWLNRGIGYNNYNQRQGLFSRLRLRNRR